METNRRHNSLSKALKPLVVALALFAGITQGEPSVAQYAPSAPAQKATPQAKLLPHASKAPLAGRVVSDTFFSLSLGVKKALTVYLPPSYQTETTRRYPVLYYLHGKTGNERNWVDAGYLNQTMDSLIGAGAPQAIIAMPDGDDGWYTTWGILPNITPCQRDTVRKEPASTYCVPWTRYDDYIVHDIVGFVDSHYRTLADRSHRGIAGLSMGGYGAMTLALNYPQVFKAAASHSGVLSPRLLPEAQQKALGVRYARDRAELAMAARTLWPQLWDVFGHDTIAWRARDPQVIAERLVERVKGKEKVELPALLIDVGVDDPWRAQNEDFRKALTRLGVAHSYAEWPGAHSWPYWRTHSAESLVFLLQQVAASR